MPLSAGRRSSHKARTTTAGSPPTSGRQAPAALPCSLLAPLAYYRNDRRGQLLRQTQTYVNLLVGEPSLAHYPTTAALPQQHQPRTATPHNRWSLTRRRLHPSPKGRLTKNIQSSSIPYSRFSMPPPFAALWSSIPSPRDGRYDVFNTIQKLVSVLLYICLYESRR